MLREIPLLPVEEGGISNSTNPPRVYLPNDGAMTINAMNKRVARVLGLIFLNKKLYKILIDKDKKIIEWLCEKLNVFSLNMSLICQELSIHLSEKRNNIDVTTVIWISRFICMNLSDISKEGKGSNSEKLFR
jgi:hypothetical protein